MSDERETKSRFSPGSYANFCRPGFLIIGQGKCGTSSLYHYLTNGHPRVLPASEKQIHYFKYYSRKGLRWYLGHFPSAESFVSQGALMTGEASPGYLPYPEVVELVKRQMGGTKIICVGRDPLDRAYSSYRYNYVVPAIEDMRQGKGHRHTHIESGHDDNEYYHQFLYSFEDMMRAELETLKSCLAPGGIGEVGARTKWADNNHWAKEIYNRRKKANLPPLIDLDGTCYGDFISREVPRQQWAKLVQEKPGKFLNVANMHLAQAMIGRSLYVYPLEWWYSFFPKEDIYFLCTEEMKDFSGEPINRVAQFLGLPSYNFSSVVSQGMYNVGGHRGYDKMTSWETAMEDISENEGRHPGMAKEEIPISDEFRKEFLDFLKPHNERLFQLVGRRCEGWSNV